MTLFHHETEYDGDVWRALLPKIERERAERLEHLAAGRVTLDEYPKAVGRLLALDWVLGQARDLMKKD